MQHLDSLTSGFLWLHHSYFAELINILSIPIISLHMQIMHYELRQTDLKKYWEKRHSPPVDQSGWLLIQINFILWNLLPKMSLRKKQFNIKEIFDKSYQVQTWVTKKKTIAVEKDNIELN